MQKVSYWRVIADLSFSVFFCADCQWVANRLSFAFLLSRHAFPSFPFPLLAAIAVVPSWGGRGERCGSFQSVVEFLQGWFADTPLDE